MKKLLLVGIAIMLFASTAYSQYIWEVGTDATKYPNIKTMFKLFDKDSNEVRNPNKADYKIIENAIQRKINSVDCPDAAGNFSIILVIDHSASMSSFKIGNLTRAEVAKKTATAWVKKLPMENCEAALMQFNSGNTGGPPAVDLLVPFSTDKTELIAAINKINSVGGTDFNAAFLWDCNHNPGAMIVAEKAKFLPVIVFITDGAHNPLACQEWQPSDFRVDLVLEYALKKLKPAAMIFSLFMGNSDETPPPDLQTLAGGTGGKVYTGFTNEEDINSALNDILIAADKNATYPPCVINWETDCSGGSAELTNIQPGASTTFTYNIPVEVKPYLEITPRDYLFLNVNPGAYQEKTITITARRNAIDLTGFTADPRFTVVSPDPLPQRIEKDKSIQVTIRYTSSDSTFAPSNFKFTGTICDSGWVDIAGGFRFCKVIDMGFNKLTDPEKKELHAAFCNYTNKDVIIENPKTEGGPNPGEFRIVTVPDYFVKAGACIDINFGFYPQQTGKRSSFFKTDAGGVTYEAEIFGLGGGQPTIQAPPPSFPDRNCANPKFDTLVIIRNTGADILKITAASINPPDVGFSFNGGNPIPPDMVIDPGKSSQILLTFAPTSAGNKTAKLKLESNASNAAILELDLAGSMDSVGFISSVDKIDFGIICPNKDTVLTFDITNTGFNSGSKPNKFTASTSSPYAVKNSGAGYDIAPNGKATVEILFNNAAEGVYNGQIEVKDELCGRAKIVQLTAKVVMPKVTGPAVIVSETVGSKKTVTLTLTNTSDRDLKIDSATPDFAQFKVTAPSLPITILAHRTVDITIEYAPDKDILLDGYLVLSGEPCNFKDSIKLTGTPTLASALIYPDKANALIGQTADVPIIIKNKSKFKESNVQRINTFLIVDASQLQLQPPYPAGTSVNGNTITLVDLPVASSNAQETVATLHFLVKETSFPCSNMVIYGTKSFGGTVVFKDSLGVFCLVEAEAELSTKEYSASPGEIFDVQILLANGVNINAFHEGITTTLKFNPSLLEPVSPTPAGDVVGENGAWWRKIDISDLPVSAGADNVLKSYKFRAMLGDARNTDIIIENSKAKKGIINFKKENPGKFHLTGVCENNPADRLFNPFSPATELMLVRPNPSDGNFSLDYSLGEDGQVKLTLFDMMGKPALLVFDKYMKQGAYNSEIDASELNSGLYTMQLRTPTFIFNYQIVIVK